jgi:signal transduction histidine kinase
MHRRRRIVLLFGFGIVLPSLLLGYLAFRGIQNDRALVEKQRLDGMRRAADEVVREVDTRIAAVEQALSDIVADRSGSRASDFEPALERLVAGNPLVEQLFELRPARELRFPVSRLLYIEDGAREAGSSPAAGSSQPAEFRAAQPLEFRDRDYPRALAAYKGALERSKDPLTTALILNSVARVQKKAGLIREAVATYETIARDHGRVVIPGGMPMGPAAGLEICGLTRELGDLAGSLRTGMALYRSLLGGEWVVEKAEFELFVGRIRDHIETLFASPPSGADLQALRTEFRTLEDEEAASRKRTERAHAFRESAAPALESRMKTTPGPGTSGSRFIRSTIDIGPSSYLVAIDNPASMPGAAAEAAWGFIVNADRLREDIVKPALFAHVPSDAATWTVRARDAAVLLSSGSLPSGPAAFTANFAAKFPDWALEFYPPPPRLIQAFLISRQGLYFLIFVLIAGILVFGLVLTIRSVSHELELARMKSDFVSTVSHEFKSPLTSIRQISEMLQSGRVPSEDRRRRYYDVLLEQSERLALLTDNILGLAKIEEGRSGFTFKPTDLASLLNDVVTSIRERVSHEGFEIGLEVGATLPPLALDRTALSQALTNLIDNAVKYSGDSRTIAVRTILEGGEVAIAVQDFGIGINKEDLPRLFERFFRAGDELTRTVKGSGLGLTLVKRIVEAHRGRIDVESEPGRGSVFTVRLPLPRREES